MASTQDSELRIPHRGIAQHLCHFKIWASLSRNLSSTAFSASADVETHGVSHGVFIVFHCLPSMSVLFEGNAPEASVAEKTAISPPLYSHQVCDASPPRRALSPQLKEIRISSQSLPLCEHRWLCCHCANSMLLLPCGNRDGLGLPSLSVSWSCMPLTK